MPAIEADYLVVGAGAMGLAFADTLVSHSAARVAIVDRNHQPGGHWTRAYPFVRLHQPSAYYGVNSRRLGSDTVDQVGWNEGLYELATGAEVCEYFDRVMQQDLLPTGRVSYFPMSEYLGDGRIRDRAGTEHTVDVARRVVDATYLQSVVPAMRPPSYTVSDGVECVPPNGLPASAAGRSRFVIIGAGKTGIDACLWLLRNGIEPDLLTWIMPRDSWFLDRRNVQPGPEFHGAVKSSFAAKIGVIQDATSIDDLFDRLEAAGGLLRLDPTVRPTMYRCATVSGAELEQLRRITGIVRSGRVERIERDRVILTGGELAMDPSVLYIDCSADGLASRPGVPVFEDRQITLQSVRGCQQVFSAGLIAYLETAYGDDETRNRLATPVPHPDTPFDLLPMTLAEQRNEIQWIDNADLLEWLASSRLNLLADTYAQMLARPRVRDRMLGMLRTVLVSSNEKLESLLRASGT